MNGTRYLKTAKIGRGGSSEVFRVVAPDGQVRITDEILYYVHILSIFCPHEAFPWI